MPDKPNIAIKNNQINDMPWFFEVFQTNKMWLNPAMAFLALQGIMARVAWDFGDVQRGEASFAASQ
ncbi:MAG: hypothetical protein KGL33_07530 [Betaproteobacteria bacterium]|jgi:hypothetical protein|uniref:hypothetical protein n=1 Tax=Thiomonas arsenitoxydans (strain DSM 22701 / CIP 110005 / 3As) TaxID=426114 RepID=UPI00239DAE7F|nr:hypothetical protein [Thiomonas arsenitoxydans]MDE2268847.1 hypothetical protein [Betaproteobacteria bacterium]HML82169.1 hypothetical protein [Thiomonas arsenitoxydans]